MARKKKPSEKEPPPPALPPGGPVEKKSRIRKAVERKRRNRKAVEKKSRIGKAIDVLDAFRTNVKKTMDAVRDLAWFFGGAAVLILFLYYWFGDSKTSFVFLGADENVIHLRVSNDGWKRSTLRDFRLRFVDLPINETSLELTKESSRKTSVPRRNVDLKKGDIEPGSVEIGLTVPGLIPMTCPALNEELLMSKLREGHALVEIDVEEAKDRPQGPWHVCSDTFSAGRIRKIVAKKIWFGGQQ